MTRFWPAVPLRGSSRAFWWDLAFWAVLVGFFLVAVVRAAVADDGYRTLLNGLFLLSSSVWLVWTWWSRQDASTRRGEPSSSRRPTASRLWIATAVLTSGGAVLLLVGSAWLGFTMLVVAVAGTLPLALEDRRRHR